MISSPMALEGTSSPNFACRFSTISEIIRLMRSSSIGRLSVALRTPEAILPISNSSRAPLRFTTTMPSRTISSIVLKR